MLALRDGGYRVAARPSFFKEYLQEHASTIAFLSTRKDTITKYLGFRARAKNYIRYGTTPL